MYSIFMIPELSSVFLYIAFFGFSDILIQVFHIHERGKGKVKRVIINNTFYGISVSSICFLYFCLYTLCNLSYFMLNFPSCLSK